jgi:hypothetical protein
MAQQQRCYNNSENYEIEEMKEKWAKNRKYLENFTCCDSRSCDELAYEYEKLVNKCHDIYGNVGTLNVNEKGRIIEPSICDRYEEKMNQYRQQMSDADSSRGGRKGKKGRKSRKGRKGRKGRKSRKYKK